MKKESLLSFFDAFDIEQKEIYNTKSVIDCNSISTAVDLLCNANCIGASGCGHSGICCRHFAHLMCCIDKSAVFLSPSEALHGGMGFLHSGDILLLASRGGKTSELIPMADIAIKKGVKIILVTENSDSDLAKMADVIIKMRVVKETDKYNSQSTSSFTALSVIFDALQSAIIEETNYKNEQFALIHPGGAVGQRLNKN